jgi:hypothetical protein
MDLRILRNIIIVLLINSFCCLKTLHLNRFLNTFDFDKEYIKSSDNLNPDFPYF